VSLCLSVWSNTVLAAWIFAKFGEYFSRGKKICRENSTFLQNITRIRLLHTPTYVHFCLYLAKFFSIRNVSDKSYRQNQNTFCVLCFLIENRAVYEIMWKNIVQSVQVVDESIIRRMHIAYWIPKATNTHSEYVILVSLCTATVVARTHVTVKLQVRYLSCYLIHCLLIDH
jgi:hypothetical protein